MADDVEDLFAGLQALSDASFPRTCPTCGCTYDSAEDYVRKTQALGGRSGFKGSESDDGKPMLELYRNCGCGSTLLEFFSERRDTTEEGQRRREVFGRIVSRLEAQGVPREDARRELLNLMRGGQSELIQRLLDRGTPGPSGT